MIKRIKRKAGFTLVEIIVVLAIIAVLLAITVPAIAGYIEQAKKTGCEGNRNYVMKYYDAYLEVHSLDNNETSFASYVTDTYGNDWDDGCPDDGEYTFIGYGDHAYIECSIHGVNEGIELAADKALEFATNLSLPEVLEKLRISINLNGYHIDSAGAAASTTGKRIMEAFAPYGYTLAEGSWVLVGRGGQKYDLIYTDQDISKMAVGDTVKVYGVSIPNTSNQTWAM